MIRNIECDPMCSSCAYDVEGEKGGQACLFSDKEILYLFSIGKCSLAVPRKDPDASLVRAIDPKDGLWKWQEGDEDGPRGVRYFSDTEIVPIDWSNISNP